MASRGYLIIIGLIIVLLLFACSPVARKPVYFHSTDLLPAPFPGLITLPAGKPKSKVLKREFLYETEVDICAINYKDTQTELVSKLNCLIKIP